jgi:hypothetical protein
MTDRGLRDFREKEGGLPRRSQSRLLLRWLDFWRGREAVPTFGHTIRGYRTSGQRKGARRLWLSTVMVVSRQGSGRCQGRLRLRDLDFWRGLSTSGLHGLCFRPSTPATRFGPNAPREPEIGGINQLSANSPPQPQGSIVERSLILQGSLRLAAESCSPLYDPRF